MTSRMNRRRFLQASAATAGYFFTADAISAVRAADGPNGKLYFAGIGVGGKGSGDISQAGRLGEVIALCDVDDNSLGAKTKEFPSAKKYSDFRKMLAEMKEIDAVTVSTPDHTHAAASINGYSETAVKKSGASNVLKMPPSMPPNATQK